MTEGAYKVFVGSENRGGKNRRKNMAVVSMKQLLEAGVHFGHQTRRWNPKMAEYIFTERNGIYIIDLQKTVKKIEEAYAFIRETVMNGGEVLFVGTKKQAQDSVMEEAERCGMYYVKSRWLGGMLTNYKTIKNRIARLKELYTMEEDGTFDLLPKKEVIKLRLQMKKLETNLGGIKDMHGVPDALFIVDPKKERNAILEARKLKIPIVAIVDTNCDPDEVDYIIPGNDDAIRAVKLISSVMANAVIEANQGEQFSETKESAPAQETVAPVVAEAAPVKETVAPVVAEAAPVKETVAPVVAEAAPVKETVAPVVVKAAPVKETVAPVVVKAVSAQETEAPVVTEEVVSEIVEVAEETTVKVVKAVVEKPEVKAEEVVVETATETSETE